MKKLCFVVSLITQDNDYQRQQAAAAQEAAARLGVEAQILFANSNAVDQSQQLLDAIHDREGVDGILVESAGRTSFPKIAEAVVASIAEAAAVYDVISPEKSLDMAAKKTKALYDYW